MYIGTYIFIFKTEDNLFEYISKISYWVWGEKHLLDDQKFKPIDELEDEEIREDAYKKYYDGFVYALSCLQ